MSIFREVDGLRSREDMKNSISLWDRAKKIDSTINTISVLIAGFLIFFPVFSITADVFFRYGFNKPIPSISEIVTMVVVFMIFLSLAYAFTEGSFVRVEILIRFFPLKIRLILGIFTNLIFFFIFGMIFWQATKFAIISTQKGEYVWGLINVPQYPAKWAVSIGIFLVLLRIVFEVGDSVIALISGKGEKV